MKRVLIFTVLVVLMASCQNDPSNADSTSEPETEAAAGENEEQSPAKDPSVMTISDENVQRIQVPAMSNVEVGDIIDAEIRSCAESYKGFYDVRPEEAGQILHGSFYFACKTPGAEGEEPSIIEYKGSFKDGRKHGVWSEKAKVVHTYAFEEYMIQLNFLNGVCQDSFFQGQLFPDIESQRYTYAGEEVCSFSALRKKANVAQQILSKAKAAKK